MNGPQAFTMRVPRAGRIGRTAAWPASACIARCAGRPCGIYVRVGGRAVIVGWWSRLSPRQGTRPGRLWPT